MSKLFSDLDKDPIDIYREGEPAFLDIETTGFSSQHNDVTVVSIRHDGSTETLVKGSNLTSMRLITELVNARPIVTFNGTNFDIPFLEDSMDITIDNPHLDLMPICQKRGLGRSLSDVESTLGIEREDDVDGEGAVELWNKWERFADQRALMRLISYNQDDTDNLKQIADHVADGGQAGVADFL